MDPNQPNQFDPNDLDPNQLGGYTNMLHQGSFSQGSGSYSPLRPTNLFQSQPNYYQPTNPMNNPAMVEQFQQWFLQQQQQQQPQQQFQQQQQQQDPQARKIRTKQPAKRRGKSQQPPRQQQQQQQQQQHEEAQHLVDEDDDEEMVPETQFQPPPPNLTRTRGGAQAVPKKAGGTHWTEEECEALTKAWLCYSENSEHGNSQKSEKLWNDVIPYFFKLVNRTPYRSYDAIVSKWTALKRELTDFIAIVNKAKLNMESGSNNVDMMEKVHRIYSKKNKKPFTHHLAYKVAERHVTWFQQKTTEELSTEASTDSNKRPRSESSFGGVDINDINLNNEFEDFDEEDLEAIDTGRPKGRDKARREAKGKAAASSSDEVFSGKWNEHLDFVKGKDARKQEIQGKQKTVLDQYNATLASQQMLADVEILMRMPDDPQHESNKELVSDIQRKIRERYGK